MSRGKKSGWRSRTRDRRWEDKWQGTRLGNMSPLLFHGPENQISFIIIIIASIRVSQSRSHRKRLLDLHPIWICWFTDYGSYQDADRCVSQHASDIVRCLTSTRSWLKLATTSEYGRPLLSSFFLDDGAVHMISHTADLEFPMASLLAKFGNRRPLPHRRTTRVTAVVYTPVSSLMLVQPSLKLRDWGDLVTLERIIPGSRVITKGRIHRP